MLKEDNQSLDEVVVVGYGTVRKADLAGSVAVLDNKAFKDQPITQISDALLVELLRFASVVPVLSIAVTILCM